MDAGQVKHEGRAPSGGTRFAGGMFLPDFVSDPEGSQRSTSEAGESGPRKRKRSARHEEPAEEEPLAEVSEEAMQQAVPEALEHIFVNAVFAVGLSRASPKVLMNLMPHVEQLTTEHIKSHLQKSRLHHDRSKSEFIGHYNAHLKGDFTAFNAAERWRPDVAADEGLSDPGAGLSGAGTEAPGLKSDDGSAAEGVPCAGVQLEGILATVEEQIRIKMELQERLQEQISHLLRLEQQMKEA